MGAQGRGQESGERKARAMRRAWCVVYRIGGTENFQWRRSLAMSRAEAEAAQAAEIIAGRVAYIEDYRLSMEIGVPDTYEHKG